MTVVMATEQGEVHGQINELHNSCQEDQFKNMSPELKAKAEKLKKDEQRMVRARYINHKESNGTLEKAYCHWAGEPIRMYKFISGHEYEVPMGLVNEVNESVVPKRSQLLDKSGRPSEKEGYERVHEFVPVKF